MLIGQRQEMRLLFSRSFEPETKGYDISARFSAFVARLPEEPAGRSRHHIEDALVLVVRLSGRVKETGTNASAETVSIVDIRMLPDREDVSEATVRAVEEFRLCEQGQGASLVFAYKAEKARQEAIREADKAQRK
jgi:hypothetical protein